MTSEAKNVEGKHVLIVCSNPKGAGSFNDAMFQTAVETLTSEGHTVEVSDLHAMGFNPVMQVDDFEGNISKCF